MNITIGMVQLTKDFVPSKEGKYLVRTVSTGPLKSIQFLQAVVKISDKSYSIDVNNQIVTHISIAPIL